jgi:glycerate 2-kinase
MMSKWSHPASVQPQFMDHITHLAEIRKSALTAADPKLAVTRNLTLHGSTLTAGTHEIRIKPVARIFLVAAGKASTAMSLAALEVLGARVVMGVAAVPHGVRALLPSRISSIYAGHPLPDKGSLRAGLAAHVMLTETKPDDLVLTLISGGGSAMLEHPVSGVSLEDLRAINTLLLRSGAPIESVNTVRRALSLIKGGGLTRMASPARVVSLIMSDVVGDRLSAIASGPTVLWRRSTRRRKEAAMKPLSPIDILKHYNIWASAPENVRFALSRPSTSLPRARRPINILVGSNRLVIEATASRAASLGFKQRLITTRMRGEARDVGLRFGKTLRRAKGPAYLLMGGETTVTVRGGGKGGRNQELALAAALALENTSNMAVMAMATDGIDGPTDAAGAIITGATIPAARALGISPEISLEQNDTYPLLKAVESLLTIGPTGTNLNDVVVGLTYR